MGRRPAMEKYKTGAGARGGLFQRRRGSVLEELDGVHLAFKRHASNKDAEATVLIVVVGACCLGVEVRRKDDDQNFHQ